MADTVGPKTRVDWMNRQILQRSIDSTPAAATMWSLRGAPEPGGQVERQPPSSHGGRTGSNRRTDRPTLWRTHLELYSRAVALFEPIIEALNRNEVRYVVVGGVAVVLHGHARLTADLDLAVDLSPAEAKRAIDALVGIGLRPRAPVEPSGFADPKTRTRWMAEHGMQVFSMWDPATPMRSVDLFADNPVDFEELWARSELLPLVGTTVRVASIPDLILLKRLAGRPEDLIDIEALEAIMERRQEDDG